MKFMRTFNSTAAVPHYEIFLYSRNVPSKFSQCRFPKGLMGYGLREYTKLRYFSSF